MQEFLSTILSFPTILFTGLMGLALLYWLVVILGAIDLDALDSLLGLDSFDAALDGALESVDAAMEGVDAAEAKAGVLSGIVNTMGARGVPVTVLGSVVLLWAWVLSYAGTKFLGPWGASLLVGLFLAVAALGLGVALAAVTVRPFRKLFVTQPAQKRAALVGKLCTVLSARVDARSGRAEIEDGGAGFVAEVRCPQDNELKRGSKALVYRYEPSESVFFIGPVDDVLVAASESERFEQGDT